MNLLNPYRFGVSSYIVDDYSPLMAYSVRKISSTATNCLRVRRSSDSTEQDIGFSGGLIDTASMESFCGAGDGFVVTWYDQSGNGHDFTQSTAVDQAQIVSSGTTVTINSQPAVKYNTSDDWIAISQPFSDGSFSLFSVVKYTTTGNGVIFDCSDALAWGSTSGGIRVDRSGGNFRLGTKVGASATFLNYADTSTAQTLRTAIINGTNRYIRVDGSASASDANGGTNDFTGPSNCLMGGYTTTGHNYDGHVQELIIFNSDQDANKTDIETNINDYFSIY